MVVDYSNLSLTKRLNSNVGSCPKVANLHVFTGFDSGLQIRTKCISNNKKEVEFISENMIPIDRN